MSSPVAVRPGDEKEPSGSFSYFKLGFKEFRAETEYQISRDDLAERIKRLPARR